VSPCMSVDQIRVGRMTIINWQRQSFHLVRQLT
jgi:hypothetical protein